jgi:hypothetical protein
MGIRTLVKRIEQAEKALLAQSIFSADCICFPENLGSSLGEPLALISASEMTLTVAVVPLKASSWSPPYVAENDCRDSVLGLWYRATGPGCLSRASR